MYFIENFYTLSASNPVQPRCRDVIEEGKHYSDKHDLATTLAWLKREKPGTADSKQTFSLAFAAETGL